MPNPEPHYDPPLNQLLTLGQPTHRDLAKAPDYRTSGIGPEHTAELIRMATDGALNDAPSDGALVWAPVHAMYALAQLGAVEAAAPLLETLRQFPDDDWLHETLPEVIAALGPGVLEPVLHFLRDPQEPLWNRVTAFEAAKQVALAHPQARGSVVETFVDLLERFAENDPTLNAELVAMLLDLQESAAAPLMERAFAAGAVDETIVGDWEDVQVELGLKEKRDTRRPNYGLKMLRDLSKERRRATEGTGILRIPDLPFSDAPEGSPRTPSPAKAARAKQRKKLEKQSRKKNRRR